MLAVVTGIGVARWRKGASTPPQPAETPDVTVDKQPVNFEKRAFDPSAPPADMPPFSPGEAAVCDSNFLSNVVVSGNAERTDDTHEMVTITKIAMTLRLNITIWVPTDASQHVLDHEEGHRQISEYYYQGAGKLAAQIGATYLGKKELVAGTDLDSAFNQFLQQEGNEIAAEYGKELDPDPAQQRYDIVTNYSRNGVPAPEAVTEVLKDVTVASTAPAAIPGN
jgi:hypothetical protein